MSWKPEILDADGQTWVGNALRFATQEECKAYSSDLASRWSGAHTPRAVESDSPINYVWRGGRAVYLTPEERRATEIDISQARLARVLGVDEGEDECDCCGQSFPKGQVTFVGLPNNAGTEASACPKCRGHDIGRCRYCERVYDVDDLSEKNVCERCEMEGE